MPKFRVVTYICCFLIVLSHFLARSVRHKLKWGFPVGVWCSAFMSAMLLQLKETNVTRLCVSKSILTVNGRFPGPEMRVHKGDTAYVNVYNQGPYGVTLHW